MALEIDDGKEAAVWIYDLAESSPLRRLTFGGRSHRPMWTRDSLHLIFSSNREGKNEMLYSQPADGSGSAEYVLKADFANTFQPESLSPDGKSLIFYSGRGVWIAYPNADRKPEILFPGSNPMLSPDGKWLAYSNQADTARSEIYVQPFPPTGVKYQVTTSGGVDPLWSPDGTHLFYLTLNERQIVSVNVQTESGFKFGKGNALPIQVAGQGPRMYDITPNGKYFVIMSPASPVGPDKAKRDQINVVLNWLEELKQRVPVT